MNEGFDDDDLRANLRGQERYAPDPDALREQVRVARASRHRARWMLPAAAATAVFVLTGLTLTVVQRESQDPASAPNAPSTWVAPTSPPSLSWSSWSASSLSASSSSVTPTASDLSGAPRTVLPTVQHSDHGDRPYLKETTWDGAILDPAEPNAVTVRVVVEDNDTSCFDVGGDAVATAESPESVTIQAAIYSYPRGENSSDDENYCGRGRLEPVAVTVQLAAPLGDRVLRDADGKVHEPLTKPSDAQLQAFATGNPGTTRLWDVVASDDNPREISLTAEFMIGWSCNPVTIARVVSETDNAVTVLAVTPDAGPGSTQAAQPCDGALNPPQRRVLKLAKPLGDRVVIDASTGETHIPVRAADLPTPAYLPRGYSADEIAASGNGFSQGIGYERRFGSGTTGGPSFTVSLNAGPSRLSWVGQPTEVIIGGYRAMVTGVGAGPRWIQWALPDGNSMEVYVDTVNDVLTLDELIKVAQSLY